MEASDAPCGEAIYGALLKDELSEQEARKGSLEQRGLAVVTSSGVLVTLILGLAALSTKASKTFVLPHAARSWLVVGLVLFVISAIASLGTNVPIVYQGIDPAQVYARLKQKPMKSAAQAERDIALTRVKTLTDADKKNAYKARALFAALLLEVLAVAAVGVAVVTVISSEKSTAHLIPGPRGALGRSSPCSQPA